MASIGLTVEAIHGHALALQGLFLEGMSQHPSLSDARLVTPVGTSERGHFLTFETEEAGALYERLAAAHIMTDVRGNRIRFGFGCYQTADDVKAAMSRMGAL